MSTMRKADKLQERDWDVILDNIERSRCVVQLGPDLCTLDKAGNKTNLANELAKELVELLKKGKKEVEIDDPHNLRIVAQIYQNYEGRDYLNREVRRFYAVHEQSLMGQRDPTLESLAALPFSLFVTSRHDKTLDYFLKKQGKGPKVKSYNFKGNRIANLGSLGTVREPLIYRLYGAYEEPDSMVLTENDLLDFLVAVVAENPGLPVDLRNLFENKSFLFLGFGLCDYYLRILLHVLKLNKSEIRSFALENSPVLEEQAAFQQRFRKSVFFYDKLGYRRLRLINLQLDGFVQELHQRWNKRHPEGSWDDSIDRPKYGRAGEGPSVFISYVKEDEERANLLTQRLRSHGLIPWIDNEGLRVGQRWNVTLEETITQEVDYFIVLQSRALSDRTKTYVHKEVKLALEGQDLRAGRFILPVQIDKDAEPLSAILREKIQIGELYDWDKDVQKLAREIKRDYERQKRG